MRIFLVYDRENAAIASYWEHYFKSCGIWVEKKKFKKKLRIPAGFKGVAMVSSEKLEECSVEDISDYVYRMPDINAPARLSSCMSVRTDAKKPVPVHEGRLVRGNRMDAVLENYYRKLIMAISEAHTEYQVLTRLFRIYSENQLWKACWFYEEFAKGEIKHWDKCIVQICERGLDCIHENISKRGENEHIRYMEFYYRYILCGVRHRTLSMRLLKCRELLEDFMPVLEKYGSNAIFQHLAGRICELSNVINKQAVLYYLQAAKCQPCSALLYDLGHSFEKVYGDDKLALRFYREACELDNDNYKALYKLASGYEMQREWIEAYCLYGRIEKKLGKAVEKDYKYGSAVSTQDIEYLYKARRRLSHICRQIFGWGDEENSYLKKMSEISQTYLSAKSFRKLAVLMGEPGKGEEIAEEIRNKFTGKCYQ